MRYRIYKKPERIESPDLRCDLHGPSSEKKMVSSRMNHKSQRGSVLVMAALRGSFSVDNIYNYNAQEHQSLFVYGSISQYHRGIVHRGSCGWGVGYCQKDYKYDDRFRKNPPPHFISINNRRPIYREGFYVG